MLDPIQKFNLWWQQAQADSPLQQKSAVCVSTVDKDGMPDGRFVDLKAVESRGFIFCTHLDAPKSVAIQHNPNTAMTIWWDHLGYQVRVNGIAQLVEDELANTYWQSRSRDAQISTLALQQSAEMVDEQSMFDQVNHLTRELGNAIIPRPASWGGYCIHPAKIEFLTFKTSRLHLREIYVRQGEGWRYQLLQP